MCKPADVISPLTLGVSGAVLKTIMPGAPDQPQVVREDPAAQQAKIESDAAQAAQANTLEQRKRLRANSLLSRAGGVGDPSSAELSTPQVYGKPNLGT